MPTNESCDDEGNSIMTSQAKNLATVDSRASRDVGEHRAILFVIGVGVVLFVVATPLYGLRFSSGIALGAAIAGLNLWTTARTVRAFLSGHGEPGAPALRASWGIFALLKFSLLLLGVYLVFHFGLVHALAFIVGLAALPLGMVALQFAGPGAKGSGSSRSAR